MIWHTLSSSGNPSIHSNLRSFSATSFLQPHKPLYITFLKYLLLIDYRWDDTVVTKDKESFASVFTRVGSSPETRQWFYLILYQQWFYPPACCSLPLPWALSWQRFGWAAHASRVSRPQACPAFGPGCTGPLSAALACSNPHPQRQSRGWGLPSPRGVPAELGGWGGWGAVSPWPGGDYLQPRVPMPSPEELAAAAGLRPINCSPSSPFPLQHREFTKFSERSKSLTKAAEPEGPWTPQPGKNAVREGEAHRAGDEGEERGDRRHCSLPLDAQKLFFLSLSYSLSLPLSDSNQSRLLTQHRYFHCCG